MVRRLRLRRDRRRNAPVLFRDRFAVLDYSVISLPSEKILAH